MGLALQIVGGYVLIVSALAVLNIIICKFLH